MQGLNPITMQCTYSTPCGWCAKWDKKCDKKIGNTGNTEDSKKEERAKPPLLDEIIDPKLIEHGTIADLTPIKINATCNNCIHFSQISSIDYCQYCKDMSSFSPSYDAMKGDTIYYHD